MDAGFTRLTTQRLVVRRFRPEDLDAFAAQHQGHGYATEAVRRLLHYLLAERGKHRVIATCDDRNTRSVVVLERVGMRREGHLLESTWAKGEWTSDLLYAVLGREWPAGR